MHYSAANQGEVGGSSEPRVGGLCLGKQGASTLTEYSGLREGEIFANLRCLARSIAFPVDRDRAVKANAPHVVLGVSN